LDAASAQDVLALLAKLNSEYGKTIVMVTHDPHAAAFATRIGHLEKKLLLPGGAGALRFGPRPAGSRFNPVAAFPADETKFFVSGRAGSGWWQKCLKTTYPAPWFGRRIPGL
jgi:ABC-type cobalamin/Fe3+-siderophores transport system ATPase subunit